MLFNLVKLWFFQIYLVKLYHELQPLPFFPCFWPIESWLETLLRHPWWTGASSGGYHRPRARWTASWRTPWRNLNGWHFRCRRAEPAVKLAGGQYHESRCNPVQLIRWIIRWWRVNESLPQLALDDADKRIHGFRNSDWLTVVEFLVHNHNQVCNSSIAHYSSFLLLLNQWFMSICMFAVV